MNACKVPCNECPFRKDSMRGWLAGYTPQELHSIVMNEVGFPCHMTHTEEDLEWEDAGTDEHPLCAGALRYMKKGAKRPRNPELLKLVLAVDIKDCEDILSVPEFIQHHTLTKAPAKV